MLNQTGQVDRHIFPSSLPLPSRTSVPVLRSVACPPSPVASVYGGAVPAFVSAPSLPYQEEEFDIDEPEWYDP